ncbi:anaerobic sulfite reductase subunit AsrA [Anaerosporobacter sp.]|uniref:anaerobic sulfite reductase subunit AsrA n=1 Tax=Anaerosporobacter sp. TaxID=1872529 RepID=UPI00286F06C1|nr:anaerobic sulfite reductase subunit AsrA [Anaerosporobacter sp.]
MGYVLGKNEMNELINTWKEKYIIYAPKRYKGGGRFSDTDCIRYGEIQTMDEIVLNQKSEYSFKEVLTPITQTLFYFTEDSISEASEERKGAIVFLRSCDLHALKRLDDMYLKNGPEDYYYKRLRDKLKIVLMGCKHAYDSCFCVDMGTNISENYDLSIDEVNGTYQMDCKSEEFAEQLKTLDLSVILSEMDIVPEHVTETTTPVHIPENLDNRINNSSMWREYDSRCINCGRCNFVCPTCICFTMQDFYYSENGKVGERRRVWASCMVDGYTDVAGGGSYRQKNGDRMRFKVLHKVLDYKERNGYHMCVGCGRCDDICPEYISFSNCINKLETGMQEVAKDE